MSDYAETSDHLAEVIGRAEGKSSGYLYRTEHLTLDQELKVCEIRALLAIASEVNAVRHMGVNPKFDKNI